MGAEDLIARIASALGTAETGDALVEVARNAHRAEMELASQYNDPEVRAEMTKLLVQAILQVKAGTDTGSRRAHDYDDPCTSCKGHSWVYSGTAYGGDDASYHGEGRCYCEFCGADGDA